MVQLDKANAAFCQAACQNAVAGKRAIPRLTTIQVQCFLGLIARIHQLRNTRLHLKRQLKLRDSRRDFRVMHDRVLLAIERIDRIDVRPLLLATDTRWIAEIENRIPLPRNWTP
jgi:hypothetical protein